MITIHPQFCPLPEYMLGTRRKLMIIDADTLEEAIAAESCAIKKGWANFMGGIAKDVATGKPALVMTKEQ